MSQQDLYLIDQIKVRNKLSLQAFCDKHGSVIYSYLIGLMEKEPDAQAVYEKTIVDIWEKSGQYDPKTKTPLQWTFDLAFQNALMTKREENAQFSFKESRPPKFETEEQIKKEIPAKPLPANSWQKIESRLLSIPRMDSMTATKFPTSSVPPVFISKDKTSPGNPPPPLPPKIPAVTTSAIPPVAAPASTSPAKDISTIASAPTSTGALTSVPPPVKVPPPKLPPEPVKNTEPKITAIPTQAPEKAAPTPPAKENPAVDEKNTPKKPLPINDATKVPPAVFPPTSPLPPRQNPVEPLKQAPVKLSEPPKKQDEPAPKKEEVKTPAAEPGKKSESKDSKPVFKPENQKLDEILKSKETSKPVKKPAAEQTVNWWAVKTFVAWGFTVIFFFAFFWIYTKNNNQVNEMKRLRTEQLESEAKARSIEEQLQAAKTLSTNAQELEKTFQERFQQFQQTIDRLETEKAGLLDEIKTKEARIEFLEGNLGRVVFMASTTSQAATFARCIWDDKAATGVVYARNLPKLREGKIWQVWAVVKDQDYSIGFINPNVEGSGSASLKLENIKGVPEEFFVTDEPLGGSSAPTGDTVISGS